MRRLATSMTKTGHSDKEKGWAKKPVAKPDLTNRDYQQQGLKKLRNRLEKSEGHRPQWKWHQKVEVD